MILPSAERAVHALDTGMVARRTEGHVVRYSNGPLHRGSADSSSNSATESPVPSPIPTPSSLTSLHPATFKSPPSVDQHPGDKIELGDIRVNLICNWLYQKQMQRMWSMGEDEEGVMVRRSKNNYSCCPIALSSHSHGLYDAVKQLNVKCAMTVNTRTTRLMLKLNANEKLLLSNGLQIQVLPDIVSLPMCQKNQYAAFIREPPVLIVWDDDPGHIIDRVQELDAMMMSLMWNGHVQNGKTETQSDSDAHHSFHSANNYEAGKTVPYRKTVLIQSLVVATTMVMIVAALGVGWRNITIEIKVQKSWLYLLFPIIGPLQAWLGLFFMQTLPTCMVQVIGPVRQMRQNSKYYSGQISRRLSGPVLPHVTIQCPVYKESLSAVIEPTIKSIRAAISIYEMQGGTANIFINDDGMRLLSEPQAQERREFYEEHNIGWVARPQHSDNVADSGETFFRAGKFKKASNMNYGLSVSIRVEERLQLFQRPEGWSTEHERNAYDHILAAVLAEDKGRTWAAGNIRIGDYILLIDSDTRVPRDCLLDAVSEMERSPDVAILQFSSGVMNVTESWFEKGITFLTNMVYTAIEFAVANGDVAPFVGHNALLRWSAIQSVASSTTDQPEYVKIWSEDTVSEDFDMALRLQTSGYILRLAAYGDKGFKEGVSLTVYDELARWEKYAYGCGEFVFHPFAAWIRKGPFTPLFRHFLFSGMPFHSKISIVAYVGTYFAIGSSWLLTLLNYFAVGWYNGYLDHYYLDSFRIYFSTIVVFSVFGNFALAILRYRIDEKKLLPALFENCKWIPFLTIFLGGISLHVSQAILCHLLSIDMTWGTTSKEATHTSFFHEMPTILRKFRFTFAFCFILSATMVVLSGVGPFESVVPHDWQIADFIAVFPLALMVGCHALLPLVLNPGLMQFTF